MKLVVLMLCALTASAAHAECKIEALYDEYPPFSYEEAGRASGFDVDVLQAVLDAMSCQVHFTGLSWDDVLSAIESGKADVTGGVGYHAGRMSWAWYSEGFREERVALVVRKGESRRFPGTSFGAVMARGLRFGRTDGDTDTPIVAAALAGRDAQVKAAVSEADNYGRLLAGEIDGFLIERRFGARVAEEAGVTGRVEFHPLAMPPGRYRFMFSRARVTPEFMVQFEAQLQKLLSEDAFAPLARRYGVE